MSPKQREAAARAKADWGLDGPEVVRRAAEGSLTLNGDPVPAFTITQDYVRKLASQLRQERTGKRASPLAKLPAKDAVEALRVRLVNLADAELNYLERQRTGKRDLARFKDVCRCVREAAALPVPKDAQVKAPGSNAGGERAEGVTRSGAVGALLAESRRSRPNQSGPDPETGTARANGGPLDGSDGAAG